MVKVYEGTPEQYTMDGYLVQNLNTAKNVIKKDWDFVFIVDGLERSGKSQFSFQCAKYCDPSFNIDRIAFTPDRFKELVLHSQRYQAIVYDEAFTGMSSRAAMSKVNRLLNQMMAEIGQKNLFIFITMPSFFDLDRYIGLHRSVALAHIYTGDGFERGFFSFYNREKKKILFLKGKKLYSYKEPTPNFYGRFTNHFVIDEEEYRKRKREALQHNEKIRDDDEFQEAVKWEIFNRVYDLEWLTVKQKCYLVGISVPYFFILQRERRAEAQKEDI